MQLKHMAGGGALKAAMRAIERTKPIDNATREQERLRAMVKNAREAEKRATDPYDATRAAMLERALSTAHAAGSNMDETIRLLKLPDVSARDSVARGALTYRPPNYFLGASGVPADAVYVEELGALRTPHVPVGQALLHRLREETNGVPLMLESLPLPETLDWYKARGFELQPRNPFGNNLPTFFLPRGKELKAQGGRVKFAGGGKVRRSAADDPEFAELSRMPPRWRGTVLDEQGRAHHGEHDIRTKEDIARDRNILLASATVPAALVISAALPAALGVAGTAKGALLSAAANTALGAPINEALDAREGYFQDALAGTLFGATGRMAPGLLSYALSHIPDVDAGVLSMVPKVMKQGFWPNAKFRTPDGAVSDLRRAHDRIRVPLTTDTWQPGSFLEPVFQKRGTKEVVPYFEVDKFAGGGLARLAKMQRAGKMLSKPSMQEGVIKLRGGQWLSDHPERSIDVLRRRIPSFDPTRRMSQEQGNYIRNNFPDVPAAYDDYFRTTGKHSMHFAEDYWPWIEANRPDVLEALQKGTTPDASLNRWIDTTLRKYIMRDMATPEDPVRALAEKGTLHIDPNQFMYGSAEESVRLAREKAGFPNPLSSAQNPLARVWEEASDSLIRTQPAHLAAATETVGEMNPWLKGVPPETPVHSISMVNYDPERLAHGLGFEHLIDELANALNPTSGLPRELLLDTKSMQRLSMPQAVERVAKINEWRAAQKAAADLKRANNAAVSVFKEYAENNPKGLRWVELKEPEMLPEGWQTKPVKNGIALVSPDGHVVDTASTKEELIRRAGRPENQKALEDALRYEGDLMGHCVGGYCDNVLSGRTRIFSLRDAKGQPHVTIETQPNLIDLADFTGNHRQGLVDQEAAIKAIQELEASRELERAGRNPSLSHWIESLKKEGAGVPRIVQIKGKANQKPNDEYIPFVQDFVRSQKWGDVGDLQNTNLRDARSVFNDLEAQTLREHGYDFGDYLDAEDIRRLKEAWGNWPQDLAEGGTVSWKEEYNAGLASAPEWKHSYAEAFPYEQR